MSIANVGCTHRHHLDVEPVGAAGSEDLLLHTHQVGLGNNINITITYCVNTQRFMDAGLGPFSVLNQVKCFWFLSFLLWISGIDFVVGKVHFYEFCLWLNQILKGCIFSDGNIQIK